MREGNVISKKKDCQQYLCNAGTVNLLRCLKQSLKFVKVKTEEKRAGRTTLLDPNAAVKQISRAIAGKDTSFIGSIHGLKGSQNLATHSSMLQSAPQSVAGDQEGRKIHSSLAASKADRME